MHSTCTLTFCWQLSDPLDGFSATVVCISTFKWTDVCSCDSLNEETHALSCRTDVTRRTRIKKKTCTNRVVDGALRNLLEGVGARMRDHFGTGQSQGVANLS